MLIEADGFLSFNRLTSGPWQSFERAIARLLAHKGWEVYDVVGGSGDKGADIIASIDKMERIFQVKFSEVNKPLSVDIVGDIQRAMEFYEINDGVCVSNKPLGLEQIRKLKILKSQGYNISSFIGKDILKSYLSLPIWPTDKRNLRAYQRESLERIIDSYCLGNKRALIVLATGLGKTFVAASFLRWLYEKSSPNILVLADKRELLLQFDKAIWTNIPRYVATHLLYESEKPSFNTGITFSTFQSFENYFYNKDYHFDIVIVDEAHHAPASTFKSIIERVNPQFLLGLTATPFRTDDRSVTEIFGDPLINYGVVNAIQRGYLSRVDYHIKDDNIDLNWIGKASKKGYTITQLNKKVFIEERDDLICNSIAEYNKTHKPERGIIFCNSNIHADRVEKLLKNNYGLSVRSYTNMVKDEKERAKRLRKFRKGEIKFLTCFNMLNEGVDIPDIDFLVYLRVTHSRIIFLQQLGRGLRYKENKTLTVYDYVADIRHFAEVYKFNNEFERIRSGEIEDLKLPVNFNLQFNEKITGDFLNLVQSDIMELEELKDDDIIYI